MSRRISTQRRAWKERALSLLLAAALTVGLMPGLTLPASAEHWADAYLDQLVDWGVIRADQTADPDAELTRAEFAAIVNRAYGYTETGPIPFDDVEQSDWFYDDISIAYTAGYMLGTSATTASPDDTLTREQAVCILGRNMMMQETPGESLAFADSRDISEWARGTIKTAVDGYIISGYPDNTFHPKDSISRGQMAALITQCIGSPVQRSGDYELGGVFGNVTITAPNVTLRNTTISGDLYVSGGVGLGGIKLENVDVLGRIIVSGTGESEGGAASVIMRNVTAEELLVDNMRNKTVTVRADGITDIAKTVVRTSAYLEDNNTDDKGLMHIEVDGAPGLRLTLAGRIKEVVNKTPSSYIQVAKGTVAKLTVDEAATNSIVQIDRNTKVNEVNLDVATDVIGDGDIGQLNINAPGSVVTMLPDKIYVRPGLTASIAGVIMDYQAAEEGSLDPRLLSGYPAAKDIAPTGFRADFAGNKKGVVYWAVSYVSDGSIGEEALITPPSYGSKAIANGSVAAPTGGDEVSAQVSNLVVGGSYYLSALLVDDQNNRSPVKVISFTTPDNTVPAFGQGYPYMSRITRDVAQVTVMPTKSCKLYYALLPQGAQAPTANNLKAAAVTGNLGYGVRDVTKNTEEVFTVNNQRLEELKNYVLYLWLTDVDGANSSAVTSLRFTVPDETRPVVDPIPYPAPEGTAGNSISMRTGLSEAGIVFWAVVAQDDPYPLPNMQSDPLSKDNEMDPLTGLPVSAKLDSDYARLGVANGRGAKARGQVNVANADAEVTFNITGLEPETAYDLYYVGRDTAGNYSEKVGKITIKTLDTTGPIVRQYFTDFQGDDETERPMANSDVILYFNEDITISRSQSLLTLYETSQGQGAGKGDDVARNEARNLLRRLLKENITLWQESRTGTPSPVTERNDENPTPDTTSWIDYRYVVIRRADDGKGVELVFPNNDAISLDSDISYYFELKNFGDNADTPNLTTPRTLTPTTTANTEHVLKKFHTAFAQVNLVDAQNRSPAPEWKSTNESGRLEGTEDTLPLARMDVSFFLTPHSTQGASNTANYDIAMFADRAIGFDLYYRVVDPRSVNSTPAPVEAFKSDYANYAYKLPAPPTSAPDSNGWVYLGTKGSDKNSGYEKASLSVDILNNPSNLPALNNLSEDVTYEFAISITELELSREQDSWGDDVNIDVYVLAGPGNIWYNGLLSPTSTPDNIRNLASRGVYFISVPESIKLTKNFVATAQPRFDTSPDFIDGDTSEKLTFGLNNKGWFYYVLVRKDQAQIPTTITVTKDVPDIIVDGAPLTAGRTLTNANASYREVFWELVSRQTELENRGALVSDAYGRHQEYFKVVDDAPAQDTIISGAGRDYISGSYLYEGSNGVPETITIPSEPDALIPLTDYYIYVVLAADPPTIKSRSTVYIFNFSTTDTARPKITVTPRSGGTALLETKYGSSEADRIASYLTWHTFIGKDGRDTVNAMGPIELPDDMTGYGTVANGVRTISVMDALTTQFAEYDAYGSVSAAHEYRQDKDGLSVFDLFANNTQKSSLYNMIQEESSAGAPTDGDEETGAPDYQRTITWFDPDPAKGMQYAPQDYILLVMGRNKDSRTVSGQGWYTVTSFAAAEVSYYNPAAPKLKELGTNKSITDIYEENGKKYYSGGVTIYFDKAVYWRLDEEHDPCPVQSGNNGNWETDKYIGILYGYDTSPDISASVPPGTITCTSTPAPSASIPRSSFTINFTRIPECAINLLGFGFICDENGAMDTTHRLSLTIIDEESADAQGGVLGDRLRDVYVRVSFDKPLDGVKYTVGGN